MANQTQKEIILIITTFVSISLTVFVGVLIDSLAPWLRILIIILSTVIIVIFVDWLARDMVKNAKRNSNIRHKKIKHKKKR